MAEEQDDIPDFDQYNSDSEKDFANVIKEESIDAAEDLNLTDDIQAQLPLNLNVNVNCEHCSQSFTITEIEDHQKQCSKNNKKSTRKSRLGRTVSQNLLKSVI